jgi:small ligand-binding sensory domain FIST
MERSGNQFAVAMAADDDADRAARDVCGRLRSALGGQAPTVAVMFVTPSLCTDPWGLRAAIAGELGPEHLIGCTTEAVIGERRELEGHPGLSVWCALLPDVRPESFHLSASKLDERVTGWAEEVLAAGDHADPILMLADPFTFPIDLMLDDYNRSGRPPIIGGLASGGSRPGEHVIFVDDAIHFDGAAGLIVPGVPMVPVVSQGCTPVGPDMVITAGGGPMIAELAGLAAVDKIHAVVTALDTDERRLVNQPLLAGLVIDENQPEYARGDFIVRGIHGRDRDTGAIYVGENVRVGQTLRLHVRDADSATDDLRHALRDAREHARPGHPSGALIFTCNGRGARFFNRPDHDASLVADELDAPSAGMFCNGELGPVGGKSFLHAFSATMAVFYDPGE